MRGTLLLQWSLQREAFADPMAHTGERREDPLRPSSQHSAEVLAASYTVWTSLYNAACSMAQFPSCCGDVDHLLHQTPSIPKHPDLLEIEEGGELCLEGGPQWVIDGSEACELEPRERALLDSRVVIGSKVRGQCSFTDNFVKEWTGFQTEHNDSDGSPNLLGVLVLGWAYVLSALAVELRAQPSESHVLYTDRMSSIGFDALSADSDTVDVHIGEVDDAEARWWAAILATGCGWQTVMKRLHGSYHPPWSIHPDQSQSLRFRIICRPSSIPSMRSLSSPPSSKEAFDYLWGFSLRNHVQDQFVAAFAAALTLPRHNRFGAAVELPRPRMSMSRTLHQTQTRGCNPPVYFDHCRPIWLSAACHAR